MMRLPAVLTSVKMLQTIAVLVFMTAFTMVPVPIAETAVPIPANLFKKRQQLLFFLVGETFKQGMIGVLCTA